MNALPRHLAHRDELPLKTVENQYPAQEIKLFDLNSKSHMGVIKNNSLRRKTLIQQGLEIINTQCNHMHITPMSYTL